MSKSQEFGHALGKFIDFRMGVAGALVMACIVFGVHSLKGTPRPVESTLHTALLIIPSTAVWAFRKRKQKDQQNIQPIIFGTTA